MNISGIVKITAVIAACATYAAAGAVCAQNYPNRPIRLVVPAPPGGGTDAVARTLAQKLTEILGQPAVVDNRAGANGIIGTDMVSKALADGYTVLITLASYHSTNPTLYANLPYDTDADFAPVSLLTENPYVITVHPSVPVKTVRELIAFVKSRPGQLSYASSGNGSAPHLGMELFMGMAGIDMVHVPYKGAGQVMTDHVSGQIPVFLNNFLAGLSMMKAGRLRPIAVTSSKRSIAMPELPTVSESGVPGYVVTGWCGMLVPRKTPPAVVNALHGGTVKALRSKDVSDRFSNEGTEIVANTPQEFADFLKADISKWAAVIKKVKVKLEVN